MTLQITLDVEFDPAKQSLIIASARERFLQAVTEAYDTAGNIVSPASIAPDDLDDAVAELIYAAIEDSDRCESVGVRASGYTFENRKQEKLN